MATNVFFFFSHGFIGDRVQKSWSPSHFVCLGRIIWIPPSDVFYWHFFSHACLIRGLNRWPSTVFDVVLEYSNGLYCWIVRLATNTCSHARENVVSISDHCRLPTPRMFSTSTSWGFLFLFCFVLFCFVLFLIFNQGILD